MRGGPPYGGRNMGGGQGKISDRHFSKVIQINALFLRSQDATFEVYNSE